MAALVMVTRKDLVTAYAQWIGAAQENPAAFVPTAQAAADGVTATAERHADMLIQWLLNPAAVKGAAEKGSASV